MLKLRVLTAAVLAPLLVLAVLQLPAVYFAALLGLVVLAGAWEWTGLSGYPGIRPKLAAAAAAAVLMAAAFHFHRLAAVPLLVVTCAAWLLVAVLLVRRRERGLLRWPRAARWLCGAWVLVPAWLAVGVLQQGEPEAALMLFLLVWAADTGAYVAGRRWGRRRLAPALSPGKTLEGLAGGTGAAGVIALGFAAYWGLEPAAGIGLIAWSLVTVLVSVAGDLFESNWKRLASLKDSGGLVPGHGGVLDRIDSMTAAAPFFALGWLWWFGATSA